MIKRMCPNCLTSHFMENLVSNNTPHKIFCPICNAAVIEEEQAMSEQVNFTKLRVLSDLAVVEAFESQPVLQNHIKNLNLFIEMMARSSTFAHKAHKELKKLKSL